MSTLATPESDLRLRIRAKVAERMGNAAPPDDLRARVRAKVAQRMGTAGTAGTVDPLSSQVMGALGTIRDPLPEPTPRRSIGEAIGARAAVMGPPSPEAMREESRYQTALDIAEYHRPRGLIERLWTPESQMPMGSKPTLGTLADVPRGFMEGAIDIPAMALAQGLETVAPGLPGAILPGQAGFGEAAAAIDAQNPDAEGVAGFVGRAVGQAAPGLAGAGGVPLWALAAYYGLQAFGGGAEDVRQTREAQGKGRSIPAEVLVGIGSAAIETISERLGLGALIPRTRVLSEAVGNLWTRGMGQQAAQVVREASALAAIGASEEAIAQVGQNALARFYDPTRGIAEGVPAAAAGGAIGGLALGGPGVVTGAMRGAQAAREGRRIVEGNAAMRDAGAAFAPERGPTARDEAAGAESIGPDAVSMALTRANAEARRRGAPYPVPATLPGERSLAPGVIPAPERGTVAGFPERPDNVLADGTPIYNDRARADAYANWKNERRIEGDDRAIVAPMPFGGAGFAVIDSQYQARQERARVRAEERQSAGTTPAPAPQTAPSQSEGPVVRTEAEATPPTTPEGRASEIPSSVRVPSPQSTPRQAWEQTADEYATDAEQRYTAKMGRPITANIVSGVGMSAHKQHRGIVERALAAGSPVPPRVLADYPDLQPKGAERAAWQMTRAEWKEWASPAVAVTPNIHELAVQRAVEDGKTVPKAVLDEYPYLQTVEQFAGLKIYAYYRPKAVDAKVKQHRAAVAEAVASGAYVPPNVLAEYPNLQPKGPPDAQEAEAAQAAVLSATPAPKLEYGELPLRVKGYRGGPAEGKVGGTFYSADRSVAESYAKGRGETVTEQNLEFHRPLIAENWMDAKEDLGLHPSSPMSALLYLAKKRGHDAVVFRNHNGYPEFVTLAQVRELKPGEPLPEGAARVSVATSSDAAFRTAHRLVSETGTPHAVQGSQVYRLDPAPAPAPTYQQLKTRAQALGVWEGPKSRSALIQRIQDAEAVRSTIPRGQDTAQAGEGPRDAGRRTPGDEVDATRPSPPRAEDHRSGEERQRASLYEKPVAASWVKQRREWTLRHFSPTDLRRRLAEAVRTEYPPAFDAEETMLTPDAAYEMGQHAGFDTSFHSKVPAELREALTGPNRHLLRYVQSNMPRGMGEDSLAELGLDRYIDMMKRTFSSDEAKAEAFARSIRNKPEARAQFPVTAFWAWVRDNAGPTWRDSHPNIVDRPGRLPDGTTFTIGGVPFAVFKSESETVIIEQQQEQEAQGEESGDPLAALAAPADPVVVPIERIDAIPVDAGSLVIGEDFWEPAEPASKPDRPAGVFGQDVIPPATGRQREMVFETETRAEERPAESATDAKIKAKFDEGATPTFEKAQPQRWKKGDTFRLGRDTYRVELVERNAQTPNHPPDDWITAVRIGEGGKPLTAKSRSADNILQVSHRWLADQGATPPQRETPEYTASPVLAADDERRPDESPQDYEIRLKHREAEAATPSMFGGKAAPVEPAKRKRGGSNADMPTEAGADVDTELLPGTATGAVAAPRTLQPVPMPELIKLAQEIHGTTPTVRRNRGGARGRFYGQGKGRINIDPSAAKNPVQLARTLAHEIGHATDWLPDRTLNRGNVLGRSRSFQPILVGVGRLRGFLKDTFGDGVSNKELRRELIDLSKWWRGDFNEKGTDAYSLYRKASKELYADALSVFLNSPGELEARAPKFYKDFTAHLYRKPEVLKAYLTLQDLLAGTPEELARARRADIREAYMKGEDIRRARAAEAEASRRHVIRGLAQQLVDSAGPVYAAEKQARRARVVKDEASAIFAMEELANRDNEVYRALEKYEREVHAPLMEAGITEADVGEFMQMRRVLGDRSDLANPGGFTPAEARTQLASLEEALGEERYAMLEQAVRVFDDMVYAESEEAVKTGLYSKEAFEEKIKPNRGHYATFATLDYLDNWIPAGMKKQIGTFKPTANPLVNTMLKLVQMKRANAVQRAKQTVLIDFMGKEFPGEVKVHPPKWHPPGYFPAEPKVSAAGRELVPMFFDGKLGYVEADKYVAKMFDLTPPDRLAEVAGLLRFVQNKVFHPLWITYSATWQVKNAVFRDPKRTWRNLGGIVPGLGKKAPTIAEMLRAYYKSAPAAWARAKHKYHPTIDQMLADKALNRPFTEAMDPEYSETLDRLAAKFGVGGRFRQRAAALEVAKMPLDFLATVSNFTEALPKIAAFRMLGSRGITGKRRAYIVRNKIGTPNTSRRGTATYLTNALFPYSNVMVQGLRADQALARNADPILPNTASGFWLRFAIADGIPKFLMWTALAGGFGESMRRLMEAISDYDLTNYIVIPLGWHKAPDGTMKAVYFRIPHEDSARLLAGTLWNLLRGDSPATVQFTRGQLPGLHPIIGIGGAWTRYLAGQNPRDEFWGREIVGRDEFKAGGLAGLPDMLRWTVDQGGVLGDVTQMVTGKEGSPKAQTWEQRAVNAPGIAGLLKISDAGVRAEEWEKVEMEDREAARFRLSLPESVRALVRERYRLSRIGVENLKGAQLERYAEVSGFYSQYLRITEAMKVAREAGDKATEKELRRALEEAAKPAARGR